MFRVTKTNSGGVLYHSPFNSMNLYPRQIPFNPAALTAAEVTADGQLKPGVVVKAPADLTAQTARTLVDGAGQVAEGVTFALQKIAATNGGADLAAAGTVQITIATRGDCSRARIEEMLGRVLSVNELAALNAAGSDITLTR